MQNKEGNTLIFDSVFTSDTSYTPYLCCLIEVISHDVFYLIGSLIFCMMLLVSLSACFLIQLMEIDLLLEEATLNNFFCSLLKRGLL